MRKGFVQVVPLVVVAVLVLGGFFVVSNNNIQNQKNAVGKVLSDRDGGGDDHDGSSGGSNNSGSSVQSSSNNSQSQESKPQESKPPEDKPRESEKPEVKKVEFKKSEIKTEQKQEFSSNRNGVQTEIRKGETQIQVGGFHLEIKNEGGRIVTKVESENEGSEAAEEIENEVEKRVEQELEDKDIHFASGSAQLGFVEKSHQVRTNFPLSVNPENGQLSVTTPAGTKVVAVLPSVAVENLIRAGVLTNTNQAPEGSGGGTASATLANSVIELTTVNNQPAFLIDGFKVKKFLWVLPVNISKQTVVSAESGQLLDVKEGVGARVLDILSF